MANKTRIEDVLPEEANLLMDKYDFVNSLNKFIEEGKQLIKVEVTGVLTQSYSMYSSSRIDKGNYDEAQKNEFLAKYKKWDDYNTEFLKVAFSIPNNVYKDDYVKSKYQIHLGRDIIKEYKYDIQRQIDCLESLVNKSDLLKIEPTNKKNDPIRRELTNKVFIVHGHDGELKQFLARIITSAYLEPIILHEQEDQGKTIIEKVEATSSDIGYAIILLTGDDIFETEHSTQVRARQNVVFEMGYFIGKLGRDRVFLLKDDNVESIGDISGVIYNSTSDKSWILKLAKELRAAGYRVDANDLLNSV